MKSFTDLERMRKRAYQLLGNGRDGLFNLMDGVLTSRSLGSFAELSRSPLFQRAWPSLYKSLARSEPPAATLMQIYSEYLPVPALRTQLVLAGDHTAWPRVWSGTLKERTYCQKDLLQTKTETQRCCVALSSTIFRGALL